MTARLWSALDDPTGVAAAADRVELKVIVAEPPHDAVLVALGLDRQRGHSRRQVYYLDTADLALARCGVIVRARRIRRRAGDLDDSMVKLRRSVPVALPGHLRRSPNFVVELDALPGSADWTMSLRQSLGPSALQAAVTGQYRLGTLLSTEQHAFFHLHTTGAGVHAAPINVDDLAIHGPVEVTRRPAGTTGFDKKMVVENWVYPDGSHLLELSTKCSASHAPRVAAQVRGFLVEHGLTPARDQTTKTRASLEYFTRETTTGPARSSRVSPQSW